MLRVLVLIVVVWPSLSFANQAELVRCAAELKAIHPDGFDSQIFHANGLVLGSARVPDAEGQSQTILFVSNVRASRAYTLGKSNSRLRIEFPNPDPRRDPEIHFIQYAHSDVFGSKLSEAYVDMIAAGSPAPSKYQVLKPVPMHENAVRRHIVRLIGDELSRVSQLHIKGKLSRADLLAGNLSLCRGLKTDDPSLARWLEGQVTQLEIASTPVRRGNRTPASTFGY